MLFSGWSQARPITGYPPNRNRREAGEVCFPTRPCDRIVKRRNRLGLRAKGFDEMCTRQEHSDATSLPPGRSDRLIAFLRWCSRCMPSGGEWPGWATRAAPFLAAVLLMLSFVTFPPAPPDNSVDSSLSGVLSYAHQQGIQFGPEFVFTYGPLGFLMFFYFSPHAAGLRMAVDVAFAWQRRSACAWWLGGCAAVAVAVARPVLLDRAECASAGRPGDLIPGCFAGACCVSSNPAAAFCCMGCPLSMLAAFARWRKSPFSLSPLPAWHWSHVMWSCAAVGGWRW